MRPGKRTVQATVDSGNKVTEDNETNNSTTVDVDCPRP
jgi:subtilase family serine protease